MNTFLTGARGRWRLIPSSDAVLAPALGAGFGGKRRGGLMERCSLVRSSPHRLQQLHGPEGFRWGLGRQDAISPSKKSLKMTGGKRIKTIMPFSSSKDFFFFFLEKISSLGENPFRLELKGTWKWPFNVKPAYYVSWDGLVWWWRCFKSQIHLDLWSHWFAQTQTAEKWMDVFGFTFWQVVCGPQPWKNKKQNSHKKNK